ncbi:MAG TPA: sigma-70 family RNA polymerase sigma factor [Polyangiaceae bacterium]|nr:sigma-70 family RNA polymerase sigma factor [Polyangiaceae bacterium]
MDARDSALVALVLDARGGSRAAFGGLYERFHRVVHAVALARVPARDAGDVVQDVFADAWAKLGDLREPAAFPGWLLAAARHRAADHARRARPADEAGDLAVDPPPRAEAAAALRALRELPETYRETLIMRLVEGLTGPEIAERTGMTPDSVRVHLHRGLKLLRERLGGEGAPP